MAGKNTHDYLNNHFDSIATNNLGGGDKREWNIDTGIREKDTNDLIPKDGEEMVRSRNVVKTVYNANDLKPCIDDSKLIIPLHVNPLSYETHEELYNAMVQWWTKTKARSEKTIKTRLRHARAMEKHTLYPVNWFEYKPEQILNQMLYRQNFEYPKKAEETGNPSYGVTHLTNLWKTVNTFAEAFGIDISYWGYSPPPTPEPQKKVIPRPKTVNKLIHYWYTSDRNENALIRTLLTVGFHTGVRPEELITIKVKDVFFDEGYIFIREQKKKYRERQIWIDNPVMYSRQQNSLKNWIKVWRPKIATDISKDILFIQKDGTPFPSSDALRMYLSPFVKPVWEHFSPKKMRDWNAIARLIRTKIETKKWDTREVRVDMGHKTESTTEGYTKYAERYFRKDSYDWLRAVLKFHADSARMRRLVKEDYGASKEKNVSKGNIGKPQILTNGEKGGWLKISNGRNEQRTCRGSSNSLLRKILTNARKNRLLNRLHYLIKPFFSFFINDYELSVCYDGSLNLFWRYLYG